ncbi:amidase family protein [Nonomuraea sp. B12E4]|uniref:amidase family protein n=1 Tax=Nonomuraea sp. B12E4 TaxID=3153564 RepID=UPI00325F6009
MTAAARFRQKRRTCRTDGSIVRPAGINGVVGIKPTIGLVSRAGVVPISARQDTAGPITTWSRATTSATSSPRPRPRPSPGIRRSPSRPAVPVRCCRWASPSSAPRFSESTLIALGYAFEQAGKVRKPPTYLRTLP